MSIPATKRKAPSSNASPSFSFGLLSDIQYAPINDGHSFSGTPRFYRHALKASKVAALEFERLGVDFAVNLGDIIDGNCQGDEAKGNTPRKGEDDEPHAKLMLNDVMANLSAYSGPWFHVYGNHELYNFDRGEIVKHLGIKGVLEEEDSGEESTDDHANFVAYSSFSPAPGYKFIFVDSYDVSVLRRTGPKLEEAEKLLTSKNPNYALGNGNSPVGIKKVIDERYVMFNGAYGQTQLDWIRSELQKSKDQGEKVFLLGHQPFHPNTTPPICLPWNYHILLKLIQGYPTTIVATLGGHTHNAGYQKSAHGVHHCVVDAVLESKPPVASFLVVKVFDDTHFEIDGYGDCRRSSGVYDFRKRRAEGGEGGGKRRPPASNPESKDGG